MNLSKSGIFVLAFLVSNLTIAFAESVSNDGQRQYTPRLRANDGFPRAAAPQEALETSVPTEEDSESAIMEWFDALAGDGFMSIDFSALPSDSPSEVPSEAPSTVTSLPTVSTSPSLSPSISQAPTVSGPQPTGSPSSAPTSSPSHMPSEAPSSEPSNAPSLEPTQGSNTIITADPTLSPTLLPSSEPTQFPSSSPSISPTSVPTVEGCTVSADVRTARILQLLRSVADPEAIADPQTDQGKATEWLLNEDPRKICPDHPKILQRWALAVVYFATGGDLWFQCSNSILATDECGAVVPFEGKQRFLSGFSECEWAGITCDDLDCVEELEFEFNNLVGYIPTEIGLLTKLRFWGMERGKLTGTIPTEIAALSNLEFLDLDFNQLTGSLTTELLSLRNLTQLDLNDNKLTGSINGIGVFPNMLFLQLHDNMFTGTVPSEVGTFSNLGAFTLHETLISGIMPESVCNLLANNVPTNVGKLTSLIADCAGESPAVDCLCCTECRPLPIS